MQTASFSGLIEMIFEIIIFYYVVKFLMRLFLPIVVKKVVDKAGQNFQQQYQQYQNQQPNQAQAADTTKATKPRETKKVGEYVDFEEID